MMARHGWRSSISCTFSVALSCLLAHWQVQGACVMTQTCVNPDNLPDFDQCIPSAVESPHDPKPMLGEGWANVTGGGACANDEDCHKKGECIDNKCACQDDGVTAGANCEDYAIQCPQYKEAACCSWQQNQGMAQNFRLLASVFGHNSRGGCDACAANLMKFWCGVVCSPRQDEFMKMHLPFPSTSYRPDPMSGAEHVKVLEMDLTLEKAFTCALFDSCKGTPMASMVEAMKSSIGFLSYQAQTGAVQHGEYFHLHFQQNASTSFTDHVLRCSNYSEVNGMIASLPAQAQKLESIASTNTTKQCPCGSCRQTCSSHDDGGGSGSIKVVDNPISIWDGFNPWLVALVYGALTSIIIISQYRKDE